LGLPEGVRRRVAWRNGVGQADVEAALRERQRRHEDDQQDQQDIDERRDVEISGTPGWRDSNDPVGAVM